MAKPFKWKQKGTDLAGEPCEYEYMADRMPVMEQHEMIRRLGPPLVESLEDVLGSVEQGDPSAARKMVAKVIAGIGNIPKADHDWVLDAILSRVKRRKAADQAAQFGEIWTGTSFMYDDIELGDMYAILREAGVFTFGNFMRMVQSLSLG